MMFEAAPPLYLLSYLCHVSSRQHLQVRGQSTGLQHAAVLLLVVGIPKQDVVPQRGVLYPGLLRYVSNGSLRTEDDKVHFWD